MAGDDVGKRFGKKLQKRKMHDLADGNRSLEDIEAEQELLKKTEKVEPLKSDGKAGRNDPCPCGSGKKYKKCCADKDG